MRTRARETITQSHARRVGTDTGCVSEQGAIDGHACTGRRAHNAWIAWARQSQTTDPTVKPMRPVCGLSCNPAAAGEGRALPKIGLGCSVAGATQLAHS